MVIGTDADSVRAGLSKSMSALLRPETGAAPNTTVPGKPDRIEGQGERVLRAGWKGSPDAALGLQFADQAAALGRHESTGATFGERCRDIDGCTFSPSRIQLRDDLQDRASRQHRRGRIQRRVHDAHRLRPLPYASCRFLTGRISLRTWAS